MATIQLTVNRKAYEVDVDPQMPLLWVLRDVIGLTGTKFGCGIAQCGACTVHIDDAAVRSCAIPVESAANQSITTIEGLSADGSHPVQRAWEQIDVPQCGYCQAGQIMTAVALLKKNPNPTDEAINESMTNICRCGTYNRIKKAIKLAAEGA
ncbi:isoquinoline 1-oxidoreductase, alpha subunit [Parapedobacter luteus]|uniref:Isoquinoline 1-oxidoreductase, alpha subunit n=1 Tax=Parapedobacter luteus TaxID=623280 RepID=A0A1T5B1F8_9SPHI|nr:(2Fe-2S)-binding protein [Parapedobacter luteus]SKB41062.1 isoquinoline 1-oxidoreductase, alpha subunit [Parapedobacter luteus]